MNLHVVNMVYALTTIAVFAKQDGQGQAAPTRILVIIIIFFCQS